MCAFVYWCFDEAVKPLKMPNPIVRTAGGLGRWNCAAGSGAPRAMAAQAVNNPDLAQSGMVFVIDSGGALAIPDWWKKSTAD